MAEKQRLVKFFTSVHVPDAAKMLDLEHQINTWVTQQSSVIIVHTSLTITDRFDFFALVTYYIQD